jgi:hypothetical protein
MESLKRFAVGLIGSSVFIGMMTVYFWVMYWVATHVWDLLQALTD